MIFRPDIKPPMWGPPDAVQYAVRVNAERMGVDPAKIASYLPLFEGAGFSALDLASGVVIPASSTNFGWNSGNLVLPSPPARLSTTKHVVPVIGTGDYTVVVVARPASLTQINALFAINNYDFAAAINTSGGLYIYDSGNKTSSNTMVPITKMSSMVFSRSSGAGKYYLDGVADGSYSHLDSIPNPTTVTWLADRPAAGYVFAGDVAFCLLSVKAFTSDQIAQLHATPYALLMPVSRPVYFDLGAGGGSYTETLDTLITSISSVADRQAYRDTVDTLITSGATVEAVTGMVEALLSLGVSASTAADVQGYADGVSDTIVSAGDAADAQDYVDGPATTGVSSSDETDTQSYVDNLGDTLVSASSVTETTGTPPITESLLTTAVSASNVSAAQAYVDTVTTLAHSSSSLAEVLGLVEQIGTVGESVSTVSDRQLYYDNVAIVAHSSSSLAEVGAYIEQVAAAAVSASSLTDVLVGSFVGRYVFVDVCRARSFEDFARPRNFTDYCRPRGRRLQ